MSDQFGLMDSSMEKYVSAIASVKDVQEQLIALLSQQDVFLPVALTGGKPNLLDVVAASGAAVCNDGTCSLLGKTPSEREIEQLLQWLVLQPEEDVFEANALSQRYPEAHAWKEVGSGLLALVLSKPLRQYLLWFRPEVAQTVLWGGEPTILTTNTEQGMRLSPRQTEMNDVVQQDLPQKHNQDMNQREKLTQHPFCEEREERGEPSHRKPHNRWQLDAAVPGSPKHAVAP